VTTMRTSAARRGLAWRILSTLALAGVFLPAAATAQVSVDELEIHMRLTPQRTAITQTIPVRNDEARAQQVRVVLGDWVRDSLGNNMFLEAGAAESSCGARIKVFPATLQVAPGATELVRVSYEPAPADSGCWSIVFIETVTPPTPRPDGQGSFLTIEVRTGVKVYVHRADAVALGEVQDMAVATAWRPRAPGTGSRDTTLVREAAVRFLNAGTAHVRVRTSLEIRSAAGELLHTVEGPEAPMTPGATRIVRIAMPHLVPGDYIAIMLLDYAGDEIAAAQAEFKVP
jgi:P pilus assembly chaperone PapD